MTEDKILRQINYILDNWYKEIVEIDYEDIKGILDLYMKSKKMIELMATDLATDYHSKEWVINYYMEKINE
jgi:hypothetical protein